MSKTTFWGSKGSTRRRIGGLVNDKLVDFEVGNFGIRFIETVNNQATRWVPWADLHRLASVNPSVSPFGEFKGMAESLHGPLNESAPLRILPVEEEIDLAGLLEKNR